MLREFEDRLVRQVLQFRVIFRYLPGMKIECVFAEERRLVYELFEFEMRKLLE